MAVHLLMVTIIILILMTAATLIAAIYAGKKPSDLNNNLRNLSIFVLGHMTISFFAFYSGANSVNMVIVKALNVVSDVMYFAVIAAWINIIVAFLGVLIHKPLLNVKVVYGIIIAYGVICESIVIIAGDYGAAADEVFVANESMRYALMIMNALFGATVIAVGIMLLISGIRSGVRNAYSSGAVIFSILLILYMLWILIFDYNSVNGAGFNIIDKIVIDPLFIICSLLDAAILFFFFIKDPLDIFSKHSTQKKEELLDDFAERYKLTGREREVLEKACRGLNNPDIAESLFISEYTVKRHMNNIFQKTEVKNRYELISKVLGK